MAWRLESPALCLSPTAAIQHQWIERATQHLQSIESGPREAACELCLATDFSCKRPALVSRTYQSLLAGDDPDSHWPAALRRLGIGTLILDECHHLGGSWGDCVARLIEAVEGLRVIALTATPVQVPGAAIEAHLGPPDHTISLPSVVRSGDLSPFQDLCLVVMPSAEEDEGLARNSRTAKHPSGAGSRTARFWRLPECSPCFGVADPQLGPGGEVERNVALGPDARRSAAESQITGVSLFHLGERTHAADAHRPAWTVRVCTPENAVATLGHNARLPT